MLAVFKKHNLSDIMETRKAQKMRKIVKKKSIWQKGQDSCDNTRTNQNDSLQTLINFHIEDKTQIVKHLQKTFRLYFSHNYSLSLLKWVVTSQNNVIERHFDSSKKSYYILKGKITIKERKNNLRESALGKKNQINQNPHSIFEVQEGKGIGRLFSQIQYQRCIIQTENSILLQIVHPDQYFHYIEKDCLLTTSQREAIIKQFKIFQSINNLNKFYLPFFQLKTYSKGQYIYRINQNPAYLYLIIEGEIEHESKIPINNPQDMARSSTLTELIKKNRNKQYSLVVTEIVSSYNFFGEEELLESTPRKQNAKCLSVNLMLFSIHIDRVRKLLTFPQFHQTLQASSILKQRERSLKLSNYHQFRTLTTISEQEQIHSKTQFVQFNKTIYKTLSDFKQQSPTKLSLLDNSRKYIHGNSIKKYQKSEGNLCQRFSMLDVNRTMYQQTLKRFRYSLQEIKRKSMPKQKIELIKGRNIQQLWRKLKLQGLFKDQERLDLDDSEEGMKSYQAHVRLVRHLKKTKSYKPKSVTFGCKIKKQYVQFLQNNI